MVSDKLYNLFEAYIDFAASNIQQEEIPATFVRKFEQQSENGGEIKIEKIPRFDRSEVYYHAFIDSNPAQALVEYSTEKYEWELDYRYLRRILIDVFGKNGENLDTWEDKIDSAFNKFKEDAEDRISKFRVQTYLEGSELPTETIQINNNTVLRQPTPNDLTFVEDIGSFSYLNPTDLISCDLLLEFDINSTAEYGAYPPHSILRNFYLKILRIYSRSSIPVIAETSELRTFLGDDLGWSVPNTDHDSLPQMILTENDKVPLQQLVELLSESYSKQDATFSYPLSAAIDHFETSIEKRAYSRESITFAVIGLESLYTSGRGKVSTYCAFLLGSTSSYFDSNEVQSTVEKAYNNYRNSWAHGGSRKSGGKEIQRRLWDYLRSSIVLFTWLSRNKRFDKNVRNNILKRVNKGMVDNDSRRELLDELDQLKLKEYLQLPKMD